MWLFGFQPSLLELFLSALERTKPTLTSETMKGCRVGRERLCYPSVITATVPGKFFTEKIRGGDQGLEGRTWSCDWTMGLFRR